jgi:hypothetical protein
MCPHCEPDGLRLPVVMLPRKCRAHEVRSPMGDTSAAGAAEERARIVAMMRRKATAHARLSRLRSSPRARQWWDLDRANEHEGAEVALDTMADRIERGEP